MALLGLNMPLPSTSATVPSLFPSSSSFSSTSCSFPKSSSSILTRRPFLCSSLLFVPSLHHLSATLLVPTRRLQRHIVRMAPEEEKMTRRSPLDFPIEWERPKPGRRPDIFPQFSPMKTPLPAPLPADPPEEDEEEEEKKEEEEEEENPEKEENDEPGLQ
ncbi:uncharacterized protein LOC129290745 [Prosopis cineraria]|uniref:uncharacterized protein LOC129290745 n=1 Tax=Prosopis cineraria TaxID=364024 RepID=UPI0024108631|nr:uncharacterized protein LOC129290745 [Prosopis cineraria]